MASFDNNSLYEQDMTYEEWECAIKDYIFDDADRIILKKHLLDNVTFESLADEIKRSKQTIQARYNKASERLFERVRKAKQKEKSEKDKLKSETPGTWV